jgi:4-amino-4-deoxy-L-arabinose transferase-like glycosyltransferase
MSDLPQKGKLWASVPKLAWLLLGLGTFFRIVSFAFSVNSGGDAWARALLTAQWLEHPTFKLIFDVYPPGHFWLIGLVAVIFHDVVFAARFLSLVLGVASLFLVWRLTEELFGAWAGLLGLAVFVFYSTHIGYSTTSSAEVSYLFFALLALYFFFSYYTRFPDLWRLAAAGIAFSLAESIRYEAWILCFGAGLICLWFALQPKTGAPSVASRINSLLTFAVTAGAWPIAWMAYCWRRFGDPLYQITDTHKRVAILLVKQPHSHLYEIALIPAVLLMSLSPFAIVAVLGGVKQWFTTRTTVAFAGLTVFFAAVQLSETARGEVVAVARYSLTLGALLAVLSGIGFEQLGKRFWPGAQYRTLAVVVLLLSINLATVLALSEMKSPVSEKMASISPRLRYVDRVAGVAGYLQRHLSPQDRVIFDDYNDESNILAAASGIPLIYGERAYVAGIKSVITPDQYMTAMHPRFLVYSDQGVLRSWRELPSKCEAVSDGGVGFRCVYMNSFYRIYELTYP